ncbi:hypothetical protein, partial [Alistipes putredinis]|uniref:hypothetical protein n=1 Tax=Alistipes putredinis TaxID=28117 RepID=UPI003AEF708B
LSAGSIRAGNPAARSPLFFIGGKVEAAFASIRREFNSTKLTLYFQFVPTNHINLKLFFISAANSYICDNIP